MKSKLGRTLAGLAALMLMFSFYSSRPAEAAHIKIGRRARQAGESPAPIFLRPQPPGKGGFRTPA